MRAFCAEVLVDSAVSDALHSSPWAVISPIPVLHINETATDLDVVAQIRLAIQSHMSSAPLSRSFLMTVQIDSPQAGCRFMRAGNTDVRLGVGVGSLPAKACCPSRALTTEQVHVPQSKASGSDFDNESALAIVDSSRDAGMVSHAQEQVVDTALSDELLGHDRGDLATEGAAPQRSVDLNLPVRNPLTPRYSAWPSNLPQRQSPTPRKGSANFREKSTTRNVEPVKLPPIIERRGSAKQKEASAPSDILVLAKEPR